MLELQRRLQSRFDGLRGARSGPVFFVEHGLVASERDQLKTMVRDALSAHPLEEDGWDSHPLPVIVAATEVGYGYHGSGTDFWPILEDELGASFGATSRQRLRDLFVRATKRHGGACPPASPWSKAFHLIAWPIAHALAPFEFHRPLAAALARLDAGARDLDDGDVYARVRFAAGYVSARFQTWLADPYVVVNIARHLLGRTTLELATDAVDRIGADLDLDSVARGALLAANRVQSGGQASSATQAKIDTTPTSGRLLLRRLDGQLMLEAVFPHLEAAVLDPLRRSLRRRRYAPRLWNASAPVPAEQLLSGRPFAIRLLSNVERDAPLLPELNAIDLDQGHRQWLAALSLDFSPPVVFSCDSDGFVAKEVRGASLSADKRHWVLLLTRAADDQLPIVGKIGPYVCVEADPSAPAGADALRGLGYQLRFSLAVGFAGPASLNRNTDAPTFATGDLRLVSPRRRIGTPTVARLRGSREEEVQLTDDTLLEIAVEEGQHVLTISNEDESRDYVFHGVKRIPSLPAVCTLELLAPELTVQALLAGTVSVRVDSPAPIDDLELTLELEVSRRRYGVSIQLGQLPATIANDAEIWAALLQDPVRELLLSASNPILHARVGVLAAESWPLEQRAVACWWENSGGVVRLASDSGAQPFGGVSAAQPSAPPDARVSADSADAVLLAPLSVDPSYGPAAAFATRCVAPAKLKLEATPASKPRLRRRRRGDGESAGVEDLVEAYLRWSLAESTSPVAEIRRRQVARQLDHWVAELCCGEEWADRELVLQESSSDPWALLSDACARGLGQDSYIELPPGDEALRARFAVAEIQRSVPDLWTRLGIARALDEGAYEVLDLACGRAYQRLAREYAQRGQASLALEVGEGDPGTDSETWQRELSAVRDRAQLHPVAELIIPSDSAGPLIALDYALMSGDDLTDELVCWGGGAVDALSGDVPDPTVFAASIALWLVPTRAVTLDWRGALDSLVVERCVARAIRYVCLRARASGGGTRI